MCGICGYYSKSNRFTPVDLKYMQDCLAHRGPDAEGQFVEGGFALGHNRLSIIDLSEKANQPMISDDQRYVIVYNGEIYNFKEIAAKVFSTSNRRFPDTSDTKVILEAFAEWGVKAIELFNGMFVMALYDRKEQSCTLIRDRIGIKPLFYHFDGENLIFASELKALVKVLGAKQTLKFNKIAINQYLHLGYIPEPLTIYENIYKFPAGNYTIFKNNKLEFQSYWDLSQKIQPEIMQNEQEAKNYLKELLISSVQYRMISDVPFGTFLSGGIDSSLVTAIAQSVSKKSVKTFSIGFKDAKYDESKFAKRVAKLLRTNHHEFVVTEKEVIDLMPSLLDVYDEPYADSSAFPTMMVSKLAKKHVTMTLSGDGGDELFMGYGAYQWAKRLHKPSIRMFRKPIAFLLSHSSKDVYRRAAHLFKYLNFQQIQSHIFSQEQYFFRRDEVKLLLQNEFYNDYMLAMPNILGIRKFSSEEKQALFDLQHYLKDDLLVKVDRASMHYSLETRVPLLDYRIVEFAINLSSQLKIKNGVAKYLLKQVLYDYVPAQFFERPKWGFSIPLARWLKQDLNYLISEYLNPAVMERYGVVNENYVHQLKEQFLKHNHQYLYNRLWLLIVLHQFLEKQTK